MLISVQQLPDDEAHLFWLQEDHVIQIVDLYNWSTILIF